MNTFFRFLQAIAIVLCAMALYNGIILGNMRAEYTYAIIGVALFFLVQFVQRFRH